MTSLNETSVDKRTTTIEVSDVPRATDPRPETPYLQAVNRLLGKHFYDKPRQIEMVEMELDRLKVEIMTENQLDEWLVELKKRLALASAREEKTTDTLAKKSLQKKKQDYLHQIDMLTTDMSERDEERPSVRAQRMQMLEQELAEIEATEFGKFTPIEACSCNEGQLLALGQLHPVISALDIAFSDHRPLCLSPDMIWLLICQGVAQHINVEAESLRSQIVQHEGKVKIEVFRDEFIKGSPENRWDELIDELCLRVKDHIGSMHDHFVPDFSTTGSKERIAAKVVLLDAVQSYFDYEVTTRCGIPSITLEGSVEDWQSLADRVEGFAKFDLGWWLTALRPILQEFVCAVQGKVRPAFWESIYKFESISGGGAVTGWIAAFFPYFKDKHGLATVKNSWISQGGTKLDRLVQGQWGDSQTYYRDPSPTDFPSSLASVPFVWNYFSQTFHMELLAGFVGVAQDKTTLALRPEIGWAVRESPPS